MNKTVNQVQSLRTLWSSIMPSSIPVPDGNTFFLWITNHRLQDITDAILRTAKKMSRNIHQGIPPIENGAAKYCSSILGHRKSVRRLNQRLGAL